MTIFVTQNDRHQLERKISNVLEQRRTEIENIIGNDTELGDILYDLSFPSDVRAAIAALPSTSTLTGQKLRWCKLGRSIYINIERIRFNVQFSDNRPIPFSVDRYPDITLDMLPERVAEPLRTKLTARQEIDKDLEIWYSFCNGPMKQVKTLGQLLHIWPSATDFLKPRNKNEGEAKQRVKPKVKHIQLPTEEQKLLLMRLKMGLLI